ncbi:MAG: hypothetical protein PHV34_05375 [Verrucomicrobiae bacterium]|nr:hypothetical protein [Verrucomicrobiae bacterium]
MRQQSSFDLLVPTPNQPYFRNRIVQLPAQAFHSAWAGYATAKIPYPSGEAQPFWQIVQHCGEVPAQWSFKSFITTTDRPEVELLTREYPQRWHIEEFFRAQQALGWQRAGPLNLHIRYGQMTMALIAQTTLHQLRQRLGQPFAAWDAPHFAKALLQGLDGDIRLSGDTILVTYYNAPNLEVLRQHYEHLPEKLQREKIDPRIPWLYGYKLDFRFK